MRKQEWCRAELGAPFSSGVPAHLPTIRCAGGDIYIPRPPGGKGVILFNVNYIVACECRDTNRECSNEKSYERFRKTNQIEKSKESQEIIRSKINRTVVLNKLSPFT